MKIEHIAMYVNDLEAAKNFFVKYLNGNANDGYHNKNTSFRSYFISFDDGARLEIMKKPEMTDDKKALARTGFIHVAFFEIAPLEPKFPKHNSWQWQNLLLARSYRPPANQPSSPRQLRWHFLPALLFHRQFSPRYWDPHLVFGARPPSLRLPTNFQERIGRIAKC